MVAFCAFGGKVWPAVPSGPMEREVVLVENGRRMRAKRDGMAIDGKAIVVVPFECAKNCESSSGIMLVLWTMEARGKRFRMMAWR